MTMTQNKSKIVSFFSIKIIILIAIILRLIYPIVAYSLSGDIQIFHLQDSTAYLKISYELFNNGTFTIDGVPQLLRTPGYPVFLIPGQAIGQPEFAAIVLQLFLSSLIVYLIYKISLRIFQIEGMAKLSALLYAVELHSIFYASSIMSETLFTFLLVSFIYLLLKYLETQSLRQLFFAALAISASIYVRPSGLYLPYVIAVPLLSIFLLKRKMNSSFKKKMSYSKLFIHLAILVCTPLVLTGFWTGRNYYVAGYTKFSSSFDFNIYCQEAVRVMAYKENISYSDMFEKMGCREFSYQREPVDRQVEKFVQLGIDGKEIVLENPLALLKTHATLMAYNMWKPWFFNRIPQAFGIPIEEIPKVDFRLDGFQKSIDSIISLASIQPVLFWGSLLSGVIWFIYLILALIGLFSRGFILKAESLFMLLIGAYFWAISGGISHPRMRVPIIPIICIMAGYSLFVILQKKRGELSEANGNSNN